MEKKENDKISHYENYNFSFVNIGGICNFIRYLILAFSLMGMLLYASDGRIKGERDINVYAMLVVICFLMLLRQWLRFERHCGVGKLLKKYKKDDKIYWRYTLKDGLIDRVYYSIGYDIVEYELDYERCKFPRGSGVNRYYDFIKKCGSTCGDYRTFLINSMDANEYHNLTNDRYTHCVYAILVVVLLLISGYYVCYGI